MNICQHCNSSMEDNKNGTKTFCSDACRKASSRKSDISVKSDKPSEIKSDKFVNHLTGEEHDITEVSKRTGLNYNLEERSERLGLKKYRCKGCGEPTWFGCAECGKNGGQEKNT